MYNAGDLIFFRPFVFKNGAKPKDKFFVVLGTMDDGMLLASLPTSQDHVPSDVEITDGCLELPERYVNVFVFLAGKPVAITPDSSHYTFSKNTFIYGSDLDVYNTAVFERQQRQGLTTIQKIGTLLPDVFRDLRRCLADSFMVKRKFRRLLAQQQ